MGCEHWGVERAIDWSNDIRDTIEEQLPVFPRRFAIAPDDDGSGREFRQYFVGRYRVVFCIDEDIIYVVHVGGSFSGHSGDDMGVDE